MLQNNTYQTGDPFRRYKVEHYRIVEDARLEEKNILDIHKINISSGEWIKTEAENKIFPDSSVGRAADC